MSGSATSAARAHARHAEDEVKMALSVLLLLSWLWPPLASARVLRGELDSRESWVYLTTLSLAEDRLTCVGSSCAWPWVVAPLAETCVSLKRSLKPCWAETNY